ncbi:hypothetical protein PISMIDRAFT_678909 [Pisolithus microcarpus 441]|uniref:SnoaL-like domain-containing protein n=1 Tax=Pisolithus microcarpus 441 TaxID=765257 RepID=A0A0C9ZD84_9AGAM|nr:hypothetical protein BKA83DRAFT_678909 [Pisolithus microcarpus]KIK23894.1 hypothetical protein PISMIDRAFT_678909 [Pisolithus microcarpus 441]
MSSRQQLLDAAKALCDDFARKESLDTLLSHFSITEECIAQEHGLGAVAPFVGRTFRGLESVRKYFSLVASTLTYENMTFGDYFVDTEVRKVSVTGRARFTWRETTESWDETFAYVLDFDHENKVYRYQVWGDTAAAYLARKGELTEVISGSWSEPSKE